MAFEYAVSSQHPRRVRFRLLDRVPSEEAVERTGTNREDTYTVVDTTWWVDPDSELTFRRPLPDSCSVSDQSTADDVGSLRPQLGVFAFESGGSSGQFGTLESSGVGNDQHDDHQTAGQPSARSPVARGSVLAAMPAYNEAHSIGQVVARTKRHADAVLVVDDGSDDETAERAWESGAFVVDHDRNKGYGAALKSIFAAGDDVGVDHLVILDSDGQHEPEDIPRFVAKQRATDADLVVGNRFGEGAETSLPAYRRFGLGVVNVLTNVAIGRQLTGPTIQDTQSGFRVYSRRALQSLIADDRLGERMEISTDILYHTEQHGYDVAEVDTTIKYGVEGASSLNPVYHGYLLVRNLLPMIGRERPLFVVSVLGLLFAVLGAGASTVRFDVVGANLDVPPQFAVLLAASLLFATGATLHVARYASRTDE